MDDVRADASGGFRRIEVLTGPARRRRWSVSQKARIVAETLVPGASLSEVARRWQVCPQQVFTWWRAARTGLLALPPHAAASRREPGFVPIVADAQPAPSGHKRPGRRPQRRAGLPRHRSSRSGWLGPWCA